MRRARHTRYFPLQTADRLVRSDGGWRPFRKTAFLLALAMLGGTGRSRAIVDANGNGLSDVWEKVHFTGGVDPASDPDADGQNNLQESIAGTDPHDAQSVLRLASGRAVAAAHLLRWQSVAGKRYQVEAAPSPPATNWLAQGASVQGTGAEVLAAIPLANPPWSAFRLRVLADNPAIENSRAALGGLDTDQDGVPDIDEHAAGTDPFDAASRLAIADTSEGPAVVLSWRTVLGKRYQVQGTGNPLTGTWSKEGGVLEGTDSEVALAVALTSQHRFFRLEVADADADLDGITDWESRIASIPIGSPYAALSSSALLRNGLVSHWTLDEATGQVRQDALGLNPLSDVNGNVVQGAEARLGSSAWFDYRTNKVLSAPDSPSLSVSNFTLTAWVKLWGTAAMPEFNPQYVAGKATGSTKEFSVDYTGNTVNRFRVTVGNASVRSSQSCQSNIWYFLCARLDGTNLAMSVNNSAQGSTNASPPADTTTPFTVGARTGGSNPFYGYIDEVAFWNRALTAGEVAQVYASGPPTSQTNASTNLVLITARLTATNVIALDLGTAVADLTTHSPGRFRVTRSGNLNPVTVRYAVSGDATPGVDYAPLSGTVTLAAGVNSAEVPVIALDSAILAPSKGVNLSLLPDAAYILGTNVSAEVRVLKEVALSVRGFGAVGDGTTDDTAAIQAAIGALEASTSHNALHFPAGTYCLNTCTWTGDAIQNWHQALRLGERDLAGRDLFFTGDPGAVLYSTLKSNRAHMLVARASFRSLTFRGLTWTKEDDPIPETHAEGVALMHSDLRRVEAVDFRDCTFTNCHGAVSAYGHGYNLRGKLRHFGFIRCRVANPFGSNTINAQSSYGGGTQVQLSPWINSAVYSDNFFEGGSDNPDPVKNPGGVRKDGSHFGSPLQLLFTNNLVRRMGVEAVHQIDDPYLGTTATPFTIPPADGTTTATVTLLPIPSPYAPGQILNFRTWFTGSPGTSEAVNVFLTVAAYESATRTLTLRNHGLSPGQEGKTIPAWQSIYLQTYNPTFAAIVNNVIDGGAPRGDIGIASNSKATISGNFLMGYVRSIELYPNVRNPLYPPTPGTQVDANVMLTHDSFTNPTFAYGVESYGPGETILNNLVVTPVSHYFRGVVVRGSNTWIQANSVLPQSIVRREYGLIYRSVGIAIGNGTVGATAAANRTCGMDVGIGPEVPYAIVPHRVISHFSTNDVLPIDPRGLTDDSVR